VNFTFEIYTPDISILIEMKYLSELSKAPLSNTLTAPDIVVIFVCYRSRTL